MKNSELSCKLVPINKIDQFISNENTLGIYYFSKEPVHKLRDINDVPVMHIDVNATSDAFAEVWMAEGNIKREKVGNINIAYNDDFLSGCTYFMGNDNLSVNTKKAYDEIFDCISNKKFKYIYRIWNYIPEINKDQADIERYKSFCYGRAISYKENYNEFYKLPASATGIAKKNSNVINTYFLASNNPNIHYLENPLQTPAYYYPKKYGVESPSFSRACTLAVQGKNKVFVSGTASILGSETVFEGNLYKQFETTVNNISVLISKQNFKNHSLENGYSLQDLSLLKVYYRHSKDRKIVEDLCKKHFSRKTQICYLNVDICRENLLIEIEGYIN